MCQQKISQVILTGMLAVGLAFGAYAEVTEAKGETKGKAAVVEQASQGQATAQEQGKQAVEQAAPKATNMATAYPLQAEVLPPIPPTPTDIGDTEGITKWIAAVNAYMDAAQKYIDGATDDLNHIVEQRNMAIENANKVVAEYNAFFEKHQGNK